MSLPVRRHTDVLRAAAPLAGRTVLEVGCGAGRLLAWLAREGAVPIGLDPDPAQLARARAQAPGVPLVAGAGEALPFASGSLDLVLYFNSLHHVPLDRQWQALAEAARALAGGGDLLVVEPLPQGDYFALLRPLEDETEARKEAFRALHAAGALGLRMMHESFYDSRITETSWPAARARFLAANPARAAALAEVEPELERLFDGLGEPGADGGRAFSQPMRLNRLRRLP
jgi:SAM-dependent methyltransferase